MASENKKEAASYEPYNKNRCPGAGLLAGPYLLWMTGFILIPLCLILWYGLTDRDGA